MSLFVIVRKNVSDFYFGIVRNAKDDKKIQYLEIKKINGIKEIKKIKKFHTVKAFTEKHRIIFYSRLLKNLKAVSNAKQIWIHERSNFLS